MMLYMHIKLKLQIEQYKINDIKRRMIIYGKS